MKSVIIDTNGFLRLFLDDIPKQADEIEKLLKKAEKGKVRILVPQIILFEINYILEKYYLLQKQEIIEKLEAVIATPHVTLESREVFSEAIGIYGVNNISFVDSFLLARTKLENVKLFTFDKKLSSLASSKV
ncbi:MAG: hypothetical protein A3D24_04850 [Candidatus Blackburnbacteria bacterium RIFCSPHIGHO2_02_FULL_39_13]|uniref:PIN domain-containing protein n=1 Tax=Candidatus Blackburnbacteria bacterium RIFCSPLOWO2_01_FULL_40_20 TaxID=1797519 RepID=A0A1G1VBB1_9BACT|nr:MAG: hypothetical protein UT38_C0007G0041 [Microgenomates group bacterium GW2011_GWA2_39_19]OGY07117.1 MAG: hypothetical protein A2694_03520 [Candidatus Blackburnbacteria bacterium RIFCSPHIGHO2_01_FULL_40_17]OGY08939.1 MAG: hypothetical protein A3D24_04850 [Candidatus Blackburnbacteria bacterium RIFCSPHIGHO2_02_FULL_39_13]OGY12715.1 MAG: hypothetical protein A3A77_00295 [Candidatus Blackburnbacteria bacterium RIFCSPLOWO2_01_FULL_40_20]OGY15303.1 MAG: hypothetical protein A3I52_01200 [Candida